MVITYNTKSFLREIVFFSRTFSKLLLARVVFLLLFASVIFTWGAWWLTRFMIILILHKKNAFAKINPRNIASFFTFRKFLSDSSLLIKVTFKKCTFRPLSFLVPWKKIVGGKVTKCFLNKYMFLKIQGFLSSKYLLQNITLLMALICQFWSY